MSDVRTRCTLCGAAIRWLESAISGRVFPIDGIPDAAGDIILVGGKARVLSRLDALVLGPSGRRYTSHHETCLRLRDSHTHHQEPARG